MAAGKANANVASPHALVKQDDLVIEKQHAQKTLGPAALLANRALAHVVNSEAALTTANGLLGDLKASLTNIESSRTFLTKPLRDHVKRIEAQYKPVVDQLEAADEALRNKVLAFYAERQKAADEVAAKEREAAEKAADKGKDEVAAEHALKAVEVQSAASVKTMVADNASVQVRKGWNFEVEDLGKVPAEYMTLDEKAVRTAIKSGLRTIPGIRIFEENSLAVTATGGGSGPSVMA